MTTRWILSDKERLEMIKGIQKRIKECQEKGRDVSNLHSDYVDWLIEQAERVQELEEEKERYQSGRNVAVITKMKMDELKKQNKRYREALEFYADEEHYKEKLISEAQYDADGICISNDEYTPPIIYFDSGEIARKALEGED